MAKYQLTAPAFIDSAFRAIGEEVEFDGPPGPHMRPLDKAAEAALAEQAKARAASDTVFTGFYGFSGEREPPPSTSAPVVVDVPAVMPMSASVGDTLTCTRGNWEGEPTEFAWVWDRTGSEIGMGETYVLVTEDMGWAVRCTVTATNAVGSTEAPPSNAVVASPAGTTTRRSR